MTNWEILDTKADKVANDYFFHVKDTVNEIDEEVICYDLTDALSKFLDNRDLYKPYWKHEKNRSRG